MSELPRGWVEDEASTICELVQSGGTPKEGFIDKPGVPFLKVYNIVDQKIDFEYRPQFIDVEIHRSSMAKSQAFPGDVLMNIVGPPLGKVAVIADSFPTWNVNQALTIFRPSEALTSEWLYYFLCGGDSVKSVINETRGSAGQVNISLSQCRAFKLPLPPLAEQKRIVAKLDAMNAKSARARTELARIETLVSRYKQAVLSKAFSGELTRKWPLLSLALLSKAVFDGPFGSNLKSADYTEDGPRVVRLENIGARQFIEEKRTHISEEKFRSLARHALQANDLLFSSFVSEEIRACLFPANTDFQAINKADCFCIRLDAAKIDPQFALLQLTSETTYRHFVQQVHGATRPRINLSQLKNYPLLVPTLEEQHEIVRRIESAFAKIDRLAKEAKRALALVGRLDEAILAKAFRGELVPQDENDESAELLLARIRAERETAPKGKRGRGKT